MNEKKEPLVSIVTPSFNSYPFIIDNIESVKNQTYSNIEHIVIDGGSTDGTVEVLKSYSHLKWVSEKDNGQSDAINKGFKLAKGEIIGWLNSDDTYNEEAITVSVNEIVKNKEIDITCGDEKIIDENGKTIKIIKGEEVTFEKLLFKNVIRQPTIFMRRNVIETLNGVREDLHYTMDRELWLRALLSDFKIKYIEDRVLANFRYCKGTKSKEMPILFKEEWVKILKELVSSPEITLKTKKIVERAIAETVSSILFLKMVDCMREGNNSLAINYFFRALLTDKKNFFKLGVWKLLVREFLIKIGLKQCLITL